MRTLFRPKPSTSKCQTVSQSLSPSLRQHTEVHEHAQGTDLSGSWTYIHILGMMLVGSCAVTHAARIILMSGEQVMMPVTRDFQNLCWCMCMCVWAVVWLS